MLDRWSTRSGPSPAGRAARRPRAGARRGCVRRAASSARSRRVASTTRTRSRPGRSSRERRRLGNHGVDVDRDLLQRRAARRDPEFRQRVEEALADIPDGTTTGSSPGSPAQSPDLVSDDGHARAGADLAGRRDPGRLPRELRRARARRWHAEGLETDLAGPYAIFADVNERTEEDLRRAETISLPGRRAPRRPDLRQPGRGLDAGARRRPRGRRRARRRPPAHARHRGLDLLGQRHHAARHGPGDRLRPLRRQPVPRGAGARSRTTTRAPSAPRSPATMRTAGRTVLFSGLTVAAAMSSLLVFPQDFLRSMGYGGIAAVLVAMLAALTVLPASLRLLGRRIDRGRVLRRAGVPRTDHGVWARIAAGVMRRPVLVLVGVTVGLLVLASPFLGVKWGSIDHRILPPDAPSTSPPRSSPTSSGPRPRPPSVLLDGTDAGRRRSVHPRGRGRRRGDLRRSRSPTTTTSRCCGPRGTATRQTGRSQDLVVADPRRRPGERRGARRWADGRDHRPRGSVADHLPWMGLVVLRRDDRAALPRVRLAGAADQGGADERAVDHRLVRRRRPGSSATATSRDCSTSPHRASSTSPTRS